MKTVYLQNIRKELDATDESFAASCCKKLGIEKDAPVRIRIVRQSLDARKKNDIFAVTPLLVLEIIVLSVIIWMVSYAAVTVPYTKDVLINEKGIFESSSVQEQFISAMGFFYGIRFAFIIIMFLIKGS